LIRHFVTAAVFSDAQIEINYSGLIGAKPITADICRDRSSDQVRCLLTTSLSFHPIDSQ